MTRRFKIFMILFLAGGPSIFGSAVASEAHDAFSEELWPYTYKIKKADPSSQPDELPKGHIFTITFFSAETCTSKHTSYMTERLNDRLIEKEYGETQLKCEIKRTEKSITVTISNKAGENQTVFFSGPVQVVSGVNREGVPATYLSLRQERSLPLGQTGYEVVTFERISKEQ